MVLQELDDTTFGSAHEALIALLLRIDDEATGMAVFMEWAAADIADTLLFEWYELAYDLFDLRSFEHSVDDDFVDSWHGSEIGVKKALTIKGGNLFTKKGHTLFTIKGGTLFTINGFAVLGLPFS